MIYVYCMDISQVTEEQYRLFYAAASKERQEKAERCRFPEDAKRCILSDILLKYSLYIFGMRQIPQIDSKENGKPYIKNAAGFFYNLSHSGKWVVLAWGSSEVGVDVEKFRENVNLERITRRFFTEEERTFIFAGADEQEKIGRFTKIWTGKEAYVKYLGTGLAKCLESFWVDSETDTIREVTGLDRAQKERAGCESAQKDANDQPETRIMLKSWLLDEEYYLSLCGAPDEVRKKNITIPVLYSFAFDYKLVMR